MGLKTLKASGGFSDLDVLPMKGEKVDRRAAFSDVLSSVAHERLVAGNANPAGSNPSLDRGVFYDVHIFYYSWYGNPQTDERYLHWDHILVPHWDPKIAASYPRGRHVPPEDIGSSFYPELGPYSTRDPEVLESHMEQISSAGAGTNQRATYLFIHTSLCESLTALTVQRLMLQALYLYMLLTAYRKLE